MTNFTPKSKYTWQIFLAGQLLADLTGLCERRQFIITRNDSDQINFTISIDKMATLAKSLGIRINDIFQSWYSEIRVSRYGTVLTAGELLSWTANVGSDRKINLTFKGWFELMKYRRTSDAFAGNTSSLTIAKQIFNETLIRPYGTSGNYNGLTLGSTPAVDSTNIYANQVYDSKTLYDALHEMTQENGGFDLEFTWDKRLNIYYPHIGVTRSDIVFTYPHGNVKDIQYSVDPTRSFNSLLARGKGSAQTQLTTTVSDMGSQQKYGLREDVRDYVNTTDTTQLTNFASEDLNIYKNPLILHTIIFDGGGNLGAPQVGTFHIGDYIQVLVTNFQLYQDINQYFRIDQIQVNIDDKSDAETVTLSVSVPTT